METVIDHGPQKVIQRQKPFQKRQKARQGTQQKCKREKVPASGQEDAGEASVPAVAHCTLENICKKLRKQGRKERKALLFRMSIIFQTSLCSLK